MAQRAFSGLATCKMLRAFCRCSRASSDTSTPYNPIRGRAAGWCALEVKKTPAQCCERLAGYEGAMSQRVCLAGPIPRHCPYYDCNRPPWCIWSDEEKRWLRDLTARHVPHGICLKGLVLCWALLLMLNRGVGRASAFMGVRDTAVCLKLLSSLSENPSMKLLGVS